MPAPKYTPTSSTHQQPADAGQQQRQRQAAEADAITARYVAEHKAKQRARGRSAWVEEV